MTVSPGVTYTVSGWFINVYPQYGGLEQRTRSASYVNGSQIYAATKSQATGWYLLHRPTGRRANTTTATLSLKGEQNGEDASYAVTDLSMQAINTPAYTTDFANGSDLWIDGSGRETDDADRPPAIVPIFNTQLQPFVRTADVISTTSTARRSPATTSSTSSTRARRGADHERPDGKRVDVHDPGRPAPLRQAGAEQRRAPDRHA